MVHSRARMRCVGSRVIPRISRWPHSGNPRPQCRPSRKTTLRGEILRLRHKLPLENGASNTLRNIYSVISDKCKVVSRCFNTPNSNLRSKTANRCILLTAKWISSEKKRWRERVVPGARIELATPAFSGRRSTSELPRHAVHKV